MEQRLLQHSDENVFLIDLPFINDGKNVQLTEKDTNDIPDQVLVELMANVTESDKKQNVASLQPETSSAMQICDKIGPSKKKRFQVLSPQQVDEIATNTVVPKTGRQTKWGIEVFRGKIHFKSSYHK